LSACTKGAGARPCGPAPGNALQLSLRLEVEAQTELNEPWRVVLTIQHTEAAAVEISARIAEHRMVEHVGHLAVETSADSFRDFGGFGDAEVHVPAVQAAI